MEDRDLTEQMTHSALADSLGDSLDSTEAELAEIS